MAEFVPFAAADQSTSVGLLNLEGNSEKLIIQGELVLVHDEVSLLRARKLLAIAEAIVEKLENSGS